MKKRLEELGFVFYGAGNLSFMHPSLGWCVTWNNLHKHHELGWEARVRRAGASIDAPAEWEPVDSIIARLRASDVQP